MNAKILTLVPTLLLIVSIPFNGAGLNSARASSVGRSAAAPEDTFYNDLVLDEGRQLLYGSDSDYDTIDFISMTTLKVVNQLRVGRGPHGMDLSPDGAKLAIALAPEHEIAILDLDTLEVTNRIVPVVTTGANYPSDILFGRSGRLYSVGSASSSSFDSIHVFDTSTWQEIGRSEAILHNVINLAMTADQNTLYVSQVVPEPQRIYRFDITSDTPSKTAETPSGPVQAGALCIMPDNKLYTSFGQVWSLDLSTFLGTLPQAGNEIECSGLNQRVFISGMWGGKVAAIDTENLTTLFKFYLNAGVVSLDAAEENLYVSSIVGMRKFPTRTEPPLFLPCITRKFCTDYLDDFSNPDSGWVKQDNAYVETKYNLGEYLVRSKQSGYLYLVRAPHCERSNYTIEADVRWKEKTGQFYGLIFDIQDDFSNYYLFVVKPENQTYLLVRRAPEGFYWITGWNFSPAIRRELGTNHLLVTHYDTNMTLNVNGVELGTWWDPGILGNGGAGIVTSPTDDRPRSDALFDNFKVAGWPVYGGAARSASGANAPAIEAPRLDRMIELWPEVLVR